ncbi:MAG: hypothetical protein KGM42_15170, partial [Hyphomicrobiales bacterium]|nr:hypothetical protein [Hyphomicrobiales bacterium]
MQINAVLTLGPMMACANLFNSLVIDCLFWNSPHRLFLALWTATLVAVVVLWAIKRHSARRPAERRTASVRATRRMTMSAITIGAFWAAPLIVMFSDVSEAQRVVLATCAAGMICGGALSLATIWPAALAFSLVIEAPTVAILLRTGDPMYIGLAALSVS